MSRAKGGVHVVHGVVSNENLLPIFDTNASVFTTLEPVYHTCMEQHTINRDVDETGEISGDAVAYDGVADLVEVAERQDRVVVLHNHLSR